MRAKAYQRGYRGTLPVREVIEHPSCALCPSPIFSFPLNSEDGIDICPHSCLNMLNDYRVSISFYFETLFDLRIVHAIFMPDCDLLPLYQAP